MCKHVSTIIQTLNIYTSGYSNIIDTSLQTRTPLRFVTPHLYHK